MHKYKNMNEMHEINYKATIYSLWSEVKIYPKMIVNETYRQHKSIYIYITSMLQFLIE